VFGAEAGGDEQDGALALDIGRVPNAGRVECIVAVTAPATQTTTSAPVGCLSQLLQLSVKLYHETSRPSSPSAAWRAV
jgi:hypothetical protein